MIMKTKKSINLASLLFLTTVLFIFFNSCDKNFNNNDTPTPSTNVGDTLWVHQVPGDINVMYIHDTPLAIGLDGSIYYDAYGSWNGDVTEPDRIYAVNKNDGSLKWKTEPLGTWMLSDIMVGDDGTIYVENYTKIYSINPATGAINWEWEVPQTLPLDGRDVYTYEGLGGLALANNGDIITKTNQSGVYYRAMYCISSDGAMKWHRFISATNIPITIGYGGTIYDFERDASYLGLLTATNPNTGALIWSMPAALVSGANNITIADNGNIITLIHTDTLACINPENHNFIWKTAASTVQDYKYISPDGFIYLYDQLGTYLYNVTTGNKEAGPVLLPHSTTFDSKGHLLGIISDYNPYLTVTDNAGEIIWENRMDGFYGWSVAISSDNIVYVANAKKLYAIQSDAPLANKGWPKYSHDNRNTFNYSKH